MTDSTSTAAHGLDPGRQTPGEYLRKLREEKGHTHAAVSTALHLTVHYIKALESDEYGKLPGLTFVKGYLRSYARFLGADVDNVLARFDEHITGLLDAGKHTERVERSRRRQDQALRWAVGAGFVVIAALGAGWWFVSHRSEAPQATQLANVTAPASTNAPAVTAAATAPRATPATTVTNTITPAPVTTAITAIEPSATAPRATIPLLPPQNGTTTALAAAATLPAATAPAATVATADAAVTTGVSVQEDGAAPTNASAPSAGISAPIVTPTATGSRSVSLIAAGNDELRVSFSGNSWIEVDDGSMVRLYNDMLRTGDTLTIRGAAPFHVLLGDASHVAVSVNAAPVDISADIRDDSTARLVLGAPVAAPASTPATEQPAAAQEVQQ